MTQARAPLAIAAVALIWAVACGAYWVTRAPIVGTAGAVDAVGTAALAMYLIAVRGGHLPRRALALTITLGLVIAKLLARDVVVIPIALELFAIALVVVRIRRARAAWRAVDGDRVDRLIAAVRATGLPTVLALELVVLAYAFAGWRRPRNAYFTATNGWPLYAGVFAFLVLVETPVVHIALHAWPIAAWIATGLSLYSIVWLIGDAHALRHGGVVVTDDAVELRLGVRWRGRIPRAAIAKVVRGREADLRAAVLDANVVIHFTSPQTLRGPLGRARTGTSIALSLDEPDRFVTRLAS